MFRPTATAGHWLELLRLSLDRLRIVLPVAAVSLTATKMPPLEPRRQASLFDFDGRESPGGDCGDLTALVERLSSRLGRQAVVRVRLRPEAQPELSWREDPWLATRRGSTGKGKGDRHLLCAAPKGRSGKRCLSPFPSRRCRRVRCDCCLVRGCSRFRRFRQPTEKATKKGTGTFCAQHRAPTDGSSGRSGKGSRPLFAVAAAPVGNRLDDFALPASSTALPGTGDRSESKPVVARSIGRPRLLPRRNGHRLPLLAFPPLAGRQMVSARDIRVAGKRAKGRIVMWFRRVSPQKLIAKTRRSENLK